jgi:hypothetical protein
MRTHFHTLVSTPFALAALLLALAVPGLPGVAAAQAPASAPAAKPAAAAPASLDAILRQDATYDGGIESSDLWKLRDYVQATRTIRRGGRSAKPSCSPSSRARRPRRRRWRRPSTFA